MYRTYNHNATPIAISTALLNLNTLTPAIPLRGDINIVFIQISMFFQDSVIAGDTGVEMRITDENPVAVFATFNSNNPTRLFTLDQYGPVLWRPFGFITQGAGTVINGWAVVGRITGEALP